MADMTEEAKKARRAYQKAWREANKDKVKATQERFWAKKAAEMAAAEAAETKTAKTAKKAARPKKTAAAKSDFDKKLDDRMSDLMDL